MVSRRKTTNNRIYFKRQIQIKMNLPFNFFANLGHLRKVIALVTIIYNFDGICLFSDQYSRQNAEHLVDNTLFDLKNGRKYDIIILHLNWNWAVISL